MATFSINMALMNLVDIMMTKIFTIHLNNYHKLKTVEIKIKVVRNSQIKNKMRGSTLLLETLTTMSNKISVILEMKTMETLES